MAFFIGPVTYKNTFKAVIRLDSAGGVNNMSEGKWIQTIILKSHKYFHIFSTLLRHCRSVCL